MILKLFALAKYAYKTIKISFVNKYAIMNKSSYENNMFNSE